VSDTIYNAVVFVENDNILHGYYFYNAATDSSDGHIFGFKDLTLPKAIQKMNEIGIDPIKNFKMNITVYYS